jgi:hypothetical protein
VEASVAEDPGAYDYFVSYAHLDAREKKGVRTLLKKLDGQLSAYGVTGTPNRLLRL